MTLMIRLHIAPLLNRIDRDQIHMTVDITDQVLARSRCVLISVIHTADQAVLKCDPSPGLFEIIACRHPVHHEFRIYMRSASDSFRLFLTGRMQRQRQRDLKLLIGEPSHVFHDSAR